MCLEEKRYKSISELNIGLDILHPLGRRWGISVVTDVPAIAYLQYGPRGR